MRADISAFCSKDHINIYTLDGVPILWQHFDGPFIPSLKILHKCKPSLSSHSVTLSLTPPSTDPAMLPHVQIDRGAIKFLLAVRFNPSEFASLLTLHIPRAPI